MDVWVGISEMLCVLRRSRDSIIRGKDLKSVRAAGAFGTKHGLMIRLPFHESIFSAGISPDFRILS